MLKKPTRLIDLEQGQKGVIISISGGHCVTRRLTDIGLVPGTEFKMVRKGRLSAIEISVRGSDLALGYGVASKILVEVKE